MVCGACGGLFSSSLAVIVVVPAFVFVAVVPQFVDVATNVASFVLHVILVLLLLILVGVVDMFYK